MPLRRRRRVGDAGRGPFIVERTEPTEAGTAAVRIGDLAERLAGAADDASLLAGGDSPRLPFLFFDLETTGLSGGAGTLAFLVGCGWFDADGAFVARQYVLARRATSPMLQALAGEFATAGALVSFNGKSFDAPLLESRFLFHRLDWLGGRLPHVDVLHPARRFWRDQAEVLARLPRVARSWRRRTDDVLGVEIPARYPSVSQDRRSPAARRRPRAQPPGSPLTGGFDVRLLDSGGRSGVAPTSTGGTRAVVACMSGLGTAGPTGVCVGPRCRVSVGTSGRRGRHIRMRGVTRAAAARWHALVEPPAAAAGAREAAEALAIHHEHRVRDLPSARDFALRSRLMWMPGSLCTPTPH